MPISEDGITYTLNLERELDEANVEFDKREQATFAVAEVVIEEIVNHMDKQISPVEGYGKFAELSDDYKKYKKEKVGNTKANLRLSGNLISNIFLDDNDENKFTIAVNHVDCPYAFNHLVGDTVPQRRFLPDDERREQFNKKIKEKINTEIKKFSKDREDRGIPAIDRFGEIKDSASDYKINQLSLRSDVYYAASWDQNLNRYRDANEAEFLDTLARFKATQEEQAIFKNLSGYLKVKDFF